MSTYQRSSGAAAARGEAIALLLNGTSLCSHRAPQELPLGELTGYALVSSNPAFGASRQND